MKRLLVLMVICSYPAAVFAHPGKTDRHGGHKCIKGCDEWGLYYEEYHLHDKDGKPIRIAKKKGHSGSPQSEPSSEASVTSAPLISQVTVTKEVVMYRSITNVSEEDVLLHNPLVFVLLMLLIFLLILRLARKRDESE